MKRIKSELDIKIKEIDKAQQALDKVIANLVHHAATNETPIGIIKLAAKVYKANQKLSLSIDEMAKTAKSMRADELRQALTPTFLNEGEAGDFTKYELLMMLGEHFSISINDA